MEEMLKLSNTNLEEMKNNDNFIQAENGEWYYIIDEENKKYKKINSL